MTAATLTSSPTMLTVRLAPDCTQEEWTAALDWVNARVAPGAKPTFVDLGTEHVYLFAAA